MEEKKKELDSLKNEMKALYKELIEESKGRYDYNYTRKDPSKESFCDIVKMINDKANEIDKLEPGLFFRQQMGSIMHKEVKYVEHHKCDYAANKKLTVANRNKLEGLMKTAISKIRLTFYDLLKDIE